MTATNHRSSHGVSWRCAAILFSLAAGAGCTTSYGVPDPDRTIVDYAAAIDGGDAEAIYAMMSEESRRSVSLEQVQRMLSEQQAELSEHAKSLRDDGRATDATAEVRYDDGEVVSLDLHDGAFRVTAADGLPAASHTPVQALSQLRRVLARRSYAGLLRVLSPRTRAALERDLRSLVEGLDEPDSLHVEVAGDEATITVPGGHQVFLKREDGVWYVDDFN